MNSIRKGKNTQSGGAATSLGFGVGDAVWRTEGVGSALKSFHITTFGCQMNQHDSEAIEGMFLRSGYTAAEAPESADVILFNTCCVRDHAEQRLYSRLSQLKEIKGRRSDLVIVVAGCVAQKEKERLHRKFPHVDIVVGPNAVHTIIGLVEEALQGERPVVAVPDEGPPLRAADYGGAGGRLHAWVTIMRGCDNYCSYCIVPYVRGPQRSKLPEEIVEEIERLVRGGVKEITLLGQNVNSYGNDLSPKASFAHLLERIEEIAGLVRIRFTTSHPKDISEDLMHAIRDLPAVCEHLHLPVQSGSSRILQLMNRGYAAREYLEKIDMLRKLIPDISLTTDVIVGFPGETEGDFEESRSLLERVQFDGAYIFKYSPREGTAAARMEEVIGKDVLKRRHRILLDCQKVISLERLKALKDCIQMVLPERPDRRRPGFLVGRTRGHRTAAFWAPGELIAKETAIRIRRIDGWTLFGELVE